MTRGLRIASSVLVMGLLFWLLPWAEIQRAWSALTPGLWGAVFAGFVGGHALGGIKWQRLLRAGGAQLAGRDTARCYAAGLFANLYLPGLVGGDVLRATLAARTTGRAAAVAVGSLTDRLLDVVTMGVLVGGGMLWAGGTLARAAPVWMAAGLLLVLAIGLGVVRWLLRRPLARWPARLRRPLGRSLVAVRRLVRVPGAALLALALSLAMQSGFVLLQAWIGAAVGIVVPLGVWFLVWPLAKLVGLLPISLGGLGVRDATLAGLLVPFGVPAALGFAASVVWQAVVLGGGLLGGLLWWQLGRSAVPHKPQAVRSPVTDPAPEAHG